MNNQKLISSLINSLTNDLDLRQELWIHYLNGNAPDTFATFINDKASAIDDDLDVRYRAWQLINHDSETFVIFLNNFSTYETSILCLLTLGLSVSQLSKYKGISEVRVRQTIHNIRYNDCWELNDGFKEKLNRGRKVRPLRGRDKASD